MTLRRREFIARARAIVAGSRPIPGGLFQRGLHC
jgi:hypothetical protein